MPAAPKPSYLPGHEYDLGDGNFGVWGGSKRGFMSAEDYKAMKGTGQAAFDDNVALAKRLDAAKAMILENGQGGIPLPGGKREIPFFGLGSNTGFMGGVGAGVGAPAWMPFRGVSGSPGFALDKKLLPARASNFVKNLTIMRENSPTGAAVGSVSDTEGEKLESLDASLNVGQPSKQLLEEIDTQRAAYNRRMPGLSKSNPIRVDGPSVIPQGAYFRTADGKLWTNTQGAPPPTTRMAPKPAAPAAPRPMARPAPANDGWGIALSKGR